MRPILFNREDFPSGRTTFLPRALDRTWHEIEAPGEDPAVLDGRRLTQVVDGEAIDAMVEAFRREAEDPAFPGLLVDEDHLSHDPERSTAALAWVKNMEARGGSLWAELEWTDTGAPAVAGKRYQKFSTEYDAGDLRDLGAGRVRPTRLAGLALTNRPAKRRGRPISNRKGETDSPEPNPRQQRNEPTMKNIAKQLGLPEDASEDQIAAQLGTILNRARRADDLEAEAAVETILNRHEKRIAEGTREEWKKTLIANREQGETLLAKMPEIAAPVVEEPAKGRPAITNRATAATPATEQAHGAATEDVAKKQQAAVLRIQNREKCKFTRAWDMARLEEPALFAQG